MGSLAEEINLGEYDEVVTLKTFQTVISPEPIMERYGSDFRTIRFEKPDKPFILTIFDDGTETDSFGVRLQGTEYYFYAIAQPLAGDISLKDIEEFSWPEPFDMGNTRDLREKTFNLYKNKDYALLVYFLALGPFEDVLWIRGWDGFLFNLYIYLVLAEAMMEKITDYTIYMWGQMLDEVGDLVQVVYQGDDLGIQERTIISSDIYRKLIMKYTKKYYDSIQSKTDVKILHYSSGSCYDLLPDLIDCRVKILNPIQTTATNMDPKRLKSEFGNDLAFWGGLDVQQILPPFASKSELEKEITRLFKIFGGNRGYVFGPLHNVQPKVPAENIVTMLETAHQYTRREKLRFIAEVSLPV